MNHAAILAPVLVHVTMTFALLLWMGRERYASVRRGEVRVAEAAIGRADWPARVRQIERSFHNQLELPPLYYALNAFAMIAQLADGLFLVLSWLFVASRLAHAFVHVTSNDVRLRGPAYIVGAFILMGMWAMFAVRLFAGS
ncbi:MAG: MAPEG family protein [Salinarimonadaceae bacterium]|nr:MAG: MAPEG family protein [Salinarimonadaceae bacterium]